MRQIIVSTTHVHVQAFSAAHSRRFTSSSWLPDLSLYMITVMRLPAAPFTALVLIVACTVVISAVAPLCIRHWWLALDGATFVGSLKGERIVHGSALPISACAVVCNADLVLGVFGRVSVHACHVRPSSHESAADCATQYTVCPGFNRHR